MSLISARLPVHASSIMSSSNSLGTAMMIFLFGSFLCMYNALTRTTTVLPEPHGQHTTFTRFVSQFVYLTNYSCSGLGSFSAASNASLISWVSNSSLLDEGIYLARLSWRFYFYCLSIFASFSSTFRCSNESRASFSHSWLGSLIVATQSYSRALFTTFKTIWKSFQVSSRLFSFPKPICINFWIFGLS